MPNARQLAENRAGGTAKKPTDALLAIAPLMLGEDHATFLAAEMLASSVHRNIIRPTGSGCCTWNLSLRCLGQVSTVVGRAQVTIVNFSKLL